jgi:hypothetical protein
MATPAKSRVSALLRTGMRVAVILVFVVMANLGLNWLLGQFQTMNTPGAQIMLTGIVVLGLLVYAILMAIPFVPGVEVGVSLLMMQGPDIAPFVFMATFLGLSLAYLVGRYMPYRVLHDLFADLGLKSACRLLEGLEPLDREERLDLMRQRLPNWLGAPFIRYRYLTVAVALNVPGNSFIGGGGGIALTAGLSKTFNNRAMLIWFALAVSPVPLAVYFFGIDMLSWFK